MPKIIENVEQKIFDAALELFGEKGYSKVEMKMIAEKIGIGVGTLYNYYRNKKDLYINVFEKSWEKTFEKLDTVVNSTGDVEKKFEIFIKILYEEMEKRNGIGKFLYESNIFELQSNRLIEIRNVILEKLNKLFEQERINNRFNKDIEVRFVSSLLASFIQIFNEHPQEKEKNIEFLLRFKILLLT